jgi:hypothetical protein
MIDKDKTSKQMGSGPITTRIAECRCCGSTEIVKVLDLGFQPFANALLRGANEGEDRYPLVLAHCGQCGLVQLLDTADPGVLFSKYVWVTGTSVTARAHAEHFCQLGLARLPEQKVSSYILEIASNDGTFLQPFIERGMPVLGVDPASNIAAAASARGIPTRCTFFGNPEAAAITAAHGPPSLIIARNVLPHVADPRDFAAGLATLMAPTSLAAIEFHDGRTILNALHYDSIYHEHVCYFTAATIARLLGAAGLHIVDLARSPISGGSLIAYVSKVGSQSTGAVAEQLKLEGDEGINSLAAWQDFGARSTVHAAQLKCLVETVLQQEGRRIVGYGASARSSTLLNFTGIDHRYVSAIADQNTLKHGLYTAGTHIPVKAPEQIFAMKPDTVLLLAWNFYDEIVSILRERFRFDGRLIIPLPGDPAIKSIM